MKKKGFIVLFALALLLSMPGAAALESSSPDSPGLSSQSQIYTAARAGDSVYFLDALTLTCYRRQASGEAVPVGSSLTVLERAEDHELYRSVMALVGGDNLYSVEMTIRRDADGGQEFLQAGLFSPNFSAEPPAPLLELDLSEAIYWEGSGENCLPCKSALLQGSDLFLLFDDPSRPALDGAESSQFLLCFSLDGGEKRTLELVGATELVYARDGLLAYAKALPGGAETALMALNAQTGEEKELFHVPSAGASRARNLLYLEDQSALLFSVGNRVLGMRSTRAEDAKPLALLPFSDPVGLFLLGGDTLVALSESQVAQAPLDWGAELPTRSLAIYNSSLNLQQFQRENPEILLEDWTFSNSEDLLSAMLTRSPKPDVFCLNTLNNASYRALRDRGYLLPLDSEAVLSVVSRIHPDLQPCVLYEGKVCALPTGLLTQGMFAVNASLWQSLDWGPIPETWPDFIAFVRDWPALAQKHPEASLFARYTDAEEVKRLVLSRLLYDYDLYRASLPEDPGYNTPEFRSLVESYQSIPFDQIDFDGAYAEEGRALLQYPWSVDADAFFIEEWQGMPLKIDAEAEAFFPVSVYVMAVNPYSQNQDLALRLLEYCANNLNPVSRVEMMPEENTPLRHEDYEENLASISDRIAGLQSRISQLPEGEERRLLEEELAGWRELLAETEANDWLVSAKGLAAYRAMSGRMSVLYSRTLNDQDASAVSEIHTRFLRGEIDQNAYIAEMDRRMTMRDLEGQ